MCICNCKYYCLHHATLNVVQFDSGKENVWRENSQT
ncbi:unnamed protein product [Schistosoma curassoni]|uniref:Uncharacterized protein n=1 Tax=Schistosoma curassoni TaxID=6186 RepID=A0A183JGM6_9TREM|nr:unnamed protein product [Schistosoma curassoni]